MSKSKSKISLADVPPGMVLVRSRAYGDHVRAKRGTYKKARLNAAFKKGTVLIGEANAAAFAQSLAAAGLTIVHTPSGGGASVGSRCARSSVSR